MENKFIKFFWFTLGGIFLILLGAFLSPLVKPIPNFSEKLFFGKTEVNIYITRTFLVYSEDELQTWDEIFMGVNGGQQVVSFQKTLIELPNKESFPNFGIDTKSHPYNYLVYIKNDGNRTVENLKGFGRMRVNKIEILNVDSFIEMDSSKTGGLWPYEKTFKFEVPRLKKGEITSFRIKSDSLSNISFDCVSDSGNCNIGLTENRVAAFSSFPNYVESLYQGKAINISIPDYRNKNGLYIYNPIQNIWVPFEDKEFGYEIRETI